MGVGIVRKGRKSGYFEEKQPWGVKYPTGPWAQKGWEELGAPGEEGEESPRRTLPTLQFHQKLFLSCQFCYRCRWWGAKENKSATGFFYLKKQDSGSFHESVMKVILLLKCKANKGNFLFVVVFFLPFGF